MTDVDQNVSLSSKELASLLCATPPLKAVYENSVREVSLDFYTKEGRTHVAFYIARQLSEKEDVAQLDEELIYLIQFFILFLKVDCLKKASRGAEFLQALNFAWENERYSGRAKDYPNNISLGQVINFLSRVEVKYKWASKSSLVLDRETLAILKKSSDMALETCVSTVKDIVLYTKRHMAILSTQQTIMNMLEGQSAKEAFNRVCPEKKFTPEGVALIYCVLKEWTNHKEEVEILDQLLKKLTSHEAQGLKPETHLEFTAESLCTSYIPQLLECVQALKNEGEYQSQIVLLCELVKKVNDSYTSSVKKKLSIFEKFLKQKVIEI